MTVLKFTKVDFILSKSQLKVFFLFAIVAVFLSLNIDNPLWGAAYMCFGCLVFSTSPFFAEKVSNNGFLNMLPITIRNRILGRYLYGVLMILISILVGDGAFLIARSFYPEIAKEQLLLSVLMLAAGIIALGIQYMVLYLAGNINNIQALGILRILPGMLLFVLANTFFQTGGIGEIEKGLRYFEANMLAITIGALVISLFILGITIAVSYWITRRRVMGK